MKWKISMQGIDTSLLFTGDGGYVYEAREGLEAPTGLPGIWGRYGTIFTIGLVTIGPESTEMRTD